MRHGRRHAVGAVLGLGLLSLTGCETSGRYVADCVAVPFGVANPVGTITATMDAPGEVNPGDTFTLTVKVIGSQDANVENPPPADAASIRIEGGASPSGNISIGSISAPATWPSTRTITVTGQPGETIDISVTSGGQFVGTPPLGYAVVCQPDVVVALVSIPIVAP